MQWIICWNIYLFIISFLIFLSSAWIVKPLAEVEDVPQPETKVMICDITVVKKQKEEDISDRKRKRGLF